MLVVNIGERPRRQGRRLPDRSQRPDRARQLPLDRNRERGIRLSHRFSNLVELLAPQFADDQATEDHRGDQRQAHQDNQ